ncbi:ATP-binding protein [Moheibacter sediminis]|uniref:histidine kinase n=1 Tax=Moheibacter sediminis TaxID=1434700 RepID=A0A1W1Z4X7_9FLAO|nr:ATP-binding protein [Moheibacter sediminis]SMC43372.1 Bacteriophytochrome (light-regulated signal transduction histidine kinase) [Moheibacter sediminis]
MNFQDCHEEQIHIPSHIQSYGYLIGLDSHKTIQFYSENILEIFDVDEEILGKQFEDYSNLFQKILKSYSYKNVDANPKETTKDLDKIILKDKEYHLTVYKFKGLIYIELEEYTKKQISRNTIYRGIKEIQAAKTEDEIWVALVHNICKITNYDRVMIYKFMNDGSGKVIAEQKHDHMESYMHLYYPESDIPKQARALYLLNYKRIFSDVHSKPVPVKSNLKEIDLTYSTVRAMSPIHAVYIKNSGASSSFSTSIIVDNKLWGLVTCHNTEAKHIDLFNRIQAEICTVMAANAYSSIKSQMIMENEALFTLKSIQLKNRLYQYDNLKESLFQNLNTVLEISHADGFAVAFEDEIEAAGETPSHEVIQNVVKWARKHLTTSFYTNHAFALKYYDEIPGLNLLCSGVAISFLGKERSKMLIWFRKEFREHIDWAGNPEKKEVNVLDFYDQKKKVISPRTSFMVFSEEIQGKSKYWSKKDILEIRKIHDTILETVQYQFEKVSLLNKELSQVNEELDSFSHTLSHDLATPLTVIKLNVQMLGKNKTDEAEKSKIDYILNEIDNMSTMMSNVLQLSRMKHSEYQLQKINPRGFIEKICEDSKLSYNSFTDIYIGPTPEIMGENTLLYQLFQNLITNAVKYSSQQENPKVEIRGKENGQWVVYEITDNGIGIPEQERENVFKLFKRFDNAKSFVGSGVGLSIAQSVMKKLSGKLTFESQENVGTTFILKFQKPMQDLN